GVDRLVRQQAGDLFGRGGLARRGRGGRRTGDGQGAGLHPRAAIGAARLAADTAFQGVGLTVRLGALHHGFEFGKGGAAGQKHQRGGGGRSPQGGARQAVQRRTSKGGTLRVQV